MPQDGNRSRVPPSPQSSRPACIPSSCRGWRRHSLLFVQESGSSHCVPESLNTSHHWSSHGQSALGPGNPTDANVDGTPITTDENRTPAGPCAKLALTSSFLLHVQYSSQFPPQALRTLMSPKPSCGGNRRMTWWSQPLDHSTALLKDPPASGFQLYLTVKSHDPTARSCSHIHTVP